MEGDVATSVLALSDVHIGCPRLDPRALHERLRTYFYPCITKDISIVFICGDFFDSLLNLNSIASLESLEIIRELKEMCWSVGCDLRVLRGTFTHDRNQPQHFVYGEDPNDVRVQLYDKLSIEYHERTGLHILYVPDNLSSQDIYADIQKLLDAHGIEKVDLMISHGYFAHMLPPNVPIPHGCLDAEKIQAYVRGCVLNGHVHLTSIYNNVISVGSFDRLSHGEEGPKGFYRVDINNKRVCTYTFIENPKANKFVTFDLRSLDQEEEALHRFSSKFKQLISKCDPNEIVRIRIANDNPIIIESCSQLAKTLWPDVIADKVTTAKRTQTIENINLSLAELPIITPDNLVELLEPIVKKRYPDVARETISEVIEQCKSL